jgi:pimeloyl-ACP methyl ester carboxylesterase
VIPLLVRDGYNVVSAATPMASIDGDVVVARHDQAINPEQERFYAKRMHAHTTELNSSHVVMISHPAEVAAIIEEAARK